MQQTVRLMRQYKMDEGALQERIAERNNVRQLCGEMQTTKDYRHLLPKVINLMAHRDIGVKRIAYSAYARHSHKVGGEALLAVNTLLQDSCHQSPLVRALVLNTLTFIHNESTVAIHQRIISDGLRDTSAFVRRHAVVSQYCISSHNSQRDTPKLLVEDPDPVVSTLSLVTRDSSAALDDSLTYCLNRIQAYTAEGVVQVLAALKSHLPSDQKQMLDVLNALDPLLETEYIDVAVSVMDIFMLCSKQAEDSLATDIHTRVLRSCLLFIRTSNTSHVYCMFLWLQECLQVYPPAGDTTPACSAKGGTILNYEIIADNYHLLLDKASDPPHLTILKLHILSLFITAGNVNIVTDNFKWILQSRYKTLAVCDAAIAFAITACEKYTHNFGDALKELLSVSQPQLQICLLKHIPSISSYDHPDCERLFTAVLPRWRVLSHSNLLALLNLSSHFASNQSENLLEMTLLADHISSMTCPSSQSLKVILLQSVTSCFLAQPVEYLGCLTKCMGVLERDSNQMMRQQVSWCVLKLKQNINK